MESFDRRANLSVFGLAALAWLSVGAIVTTLDPRGHPDVVALGAAAIGIALGLTALPPLWLLGFNRQRRIAHRGDWARAIRRAAWIGGLAGLFVLLRAEGLLALPVALFIAALAALAEGALSARG